MQSLKMSNLQEQPQIVLLGGDDESEFGLLHAALAHVLRKLDTGLLESR